MREIKFEFVEDYDQPKYSKIFPLTREGVEKCMAENKDDQFNHTVEEYFYRIMTNDYPNVKLREWTGLLDKNGKEIYECDIVESNVLLGEGKTKSIIRWLDTEACFVGNGLLSNEEIYMANRQPEVIGNIWENPDLLSLRGREEERNYTEAVLSDAERKVLESARILQAQKDIENI